MAIASSKVDFPLALGPMARNPPAGNGQAEFAEEAELVQLELPWRHTRVADICTGTGAVRRPGGLTKYLFRR